MTIPGVLILLLLPGSAGPDSTADAVFSGGRIWTVDDGLPRAEAIAVRDGRIIAVGSGEEVRRFVGGHTQRVDFEGKLVLPGFIDNHAHFISGGFQLDGVDLRSVDNSSEFADRIGKRSRQYPGRWITGGDWDHDRWPGGRLPRKELIDSLTPTTPVFVSRYDGHMALVNSVVLEMANITEATTDPPGGVIVRDETSGEPTGILKDEAMSLVYRLLPDPSEDDRDEAARRALAEARRFGVTSIQDISSSEDISVYRRLKEAGELTARIYCRLPVWQWKELADQHVRAATGDEWIRIGSLKAFADGSLGSSTALFFEPYISDPSTRGLPSDIAIDGRLERWSRAADSCGLQLSIHAIGDSANSMVLDMLQRIVAANPVWDRRFRIEHAQHLRPQDFVRYAELGVIASAQPYHAIDDGRWAEGRIGHERCRTTYAFKTFLENDVRLSFGSDWTVAPLNPLLGLYAAVTRRTLDSKNPDGWFPGEKISLEDAIRAYTVNAAYAAFEEHEKGSITPGKLADFVVLSEDLFAIDPVDIQNVHIEMTVVGGRVVFRR